MTDKLEPLIHKINNELYNKISNELSLFKSDVNSKFESIKDELRDHRRILNNHTGSLLEIESKIDIHNDMYQNNKFKIEQLNTRVTNLEIT